MFRTSGLRALPVDWPGTLISLVADPDPQVIYTSIVPGAWTSNCINLYYYATHESLAGCKPPSCGACICMDASCLGPSGIPIWAATQNIYSVERSKRVHDHHSTQPVLHRTGYLPDVAAVGDYPAVGSDLLITVSLFDILYVPVYQSRTAYVPTWVAD